MVGNLQLENSHNNCVCSAQRDDRECITMFYKSSWTSFCAKPWEVEPSQSINHQTFWRKSLKTLHTFEEGFLYFHILAVIVHNILCCGTDDQMRRFAALVSFCRLLNWGCIKQQISSNSFIHLKLAKMLAGFFPLLFWPCLYDLDAY